jgi:hypothetical protein
MTDIERLAVGGAIADTRPSNTRPRRILTGIAEFLVLLVGAAVLLGFWVATP